MPFVMRLMWIVWMVAVAAPSLAYAEDPPLGRPKATAALDHLARGNQLYKVRSFDEAAAEYRAGAVIESAPIFDYNLGQCYRQVGRYKDAIWHYEAVLKVIPPTGERATAVRSFIAQMKAELDRKAMSQPPTDPAPTPITSPSPSQASGKSVRVVEAAAAPPAESWTSDTFGWGLAATGLVGSTVSVGLFVTAAGLNDDANHAPAQSESDRLHDRAAARSLLGTVIGVGSVAVLVTGIVKLAVHPSRPDRARSTRLELSVSGSSVYVSGQF